MELKVFETPGGEWDEFASRYTDLIFYQAVWSEVLRKGLGGQPLYFCLKEGGGIVAGLPGVLLDFKFFKVLYASIPYGNLIGEQSYYPLLMEGLEKEFKKRGIDQVRITDSPFSESYPPNSYQSVSSRCSLLDLRGLDKERILEGYKKSVRRDVRKAQKCGVSIRYGTSSEDVNEIYKLYLASMERNRALAKYPLRWFEALREIVVGNGSGAFLIAGMNQVAIAGVFLVYSTSSTHYLHNGSRHEFLKFCPNELLVHSSIGDAIDKNASFFDFMGSDPRDLSLLRFKEKWGSQSREIHTYVKDCHPFRCKLFEAGKWIGNSLLGHRVMGLIRGGGC
jgi:serine/alanine adding enzyme